MQNILRLTNEAIYNKTFTDGLSSYTQANCQVTLTDIGYRIYRPPNYNPTNNGNTMWGGFVVKPFNVNSGALEKGHTYIIKFEVKGKTSNAPSDGLGWHNQVGWDGGGLVPSPSNVSHNNISANWTSDNWYPFFYKWTINDDIIKTCTTSYSSFVAGQQYISYRDFKFGFGYTDTGSLGTDLYIRNVRLYDVTTKTNEIKVFSKGIITLGNMVENTGNVSMKEDNDLYSSNFIEI